MAGIPWKSLEGEKVGQKYLLGALSSVAGDRAWFEARDPERPGDNVAVVCAPPRRAWLSCIAELKHPHLRVILGAGRSVVRGIELRYCAMEGAGQTLAERLPDESPLSTTIVRELIGQMLSALAFLHEKNLVSCQISPAAIVRIEGKWKLADLTRARAAGRFSPASTRHQLAASPYAPPEAFDGLVSPAWDSFSLGVTVNNCLLGFETRRRGRTPQLPAPFDAIVRICLDPDPACRLSPVDIASILRLPLAAGGSWPAPPETAVTEKAPSRNGALRWLPTGA